MNKKRISDEIIDKFNEQYAIVMMGGKYRVIFETTNMDGGEKIEYLTAEDFKKYTADWGKCNKKTYGHWWLECTEHRKYRGVAFDPTENAGEDIYNLYRSNEIVAAKGSWELFRKHILKVICDGNKDYYAYLMAWFARCVQEPGGSRPGTCIVMRGGKGTGKSIIMKWIGKLFEPHYVRTDNSNLITGRFNHLLSETIMLFADEAIFAGDKAAEGKLKSLITDDITTYERKNVDVVVMKNHCNVVMATNSAWAIPATHDERRFFLLDVKENKKGNFSYFRRIEDEMESGGLEGMLYDLMRWDLSGVELRDAPRTIGLMDQMIRAMDTVDMFWYSVLDAEYICCEYKKGNGYGYGNYDGSDGFVWKEGALLRKSDVYNAYTLFCKSMGGTKYKRTENKLTFWNMTWRNNGSIFKGKSKRFTCRKNDTPCFRLLKLESLKGLFNDKYPGIF